MDTKNNSSRSWFCIWNINSLYDKDDSEKTETKNADKIRDLLSGLTPEQIVDKAIEMWVTKKSRTCAVNYEIGDTGNHHLHMVLECPDKPRFSAIRKLYPGIHCDITRGNKEQAEDYILKRNKFEEKGHTVIVSAKFHGIIKANQGFRTDLDGVANLIKMNGFTPKEILRLHPEFYKIKKYIIEMFFDYRLQQTPPIREVTVFWMVGESGTGKTFTYIDLCSQYGEESIYMLTDYQNGGYDLYNAEPILFMDEFRGDNVKYSDFLTWIDKYKVQVHSRYANVHSLWDSVYITSVLAPEEAYKLMVHPDNQSRDSLAQLMRRISTIVYYYKSDNKYRTFELPASRYVDYSHLKFCASANDKHIKKMSEIKPEDEQNILDSFN